MRTTLQDSSQAIERFLAGVEKRAFRMAEIATNSREDALDIVQDAMYKLVERYGSHEAEEWGPLFQRILQSKIRDWYRRTNIRNKFRVWLGKYDDQEHSADVMDSLVDESARIPDAALDDNAAMAVLAKALQALPLRQRQVFLLRAWEGFDVAQTASAMGCSAGSVKTHYSRALSKLRDSLGDYQP